MILITTPNGKVGSEVVKQLQARGEALRIGAHTVSKARAAFPGAEVVHFDFADESSVRAALQGVSKLYLASPTGIEAAPVNRVIDLAKEAGVEHIVRLSAMGVEYGDSPLRQNELHLEASGLSWTLLRPSWFMQNFSTMSADGIRQGTLAEPAADGATAFVDARDIAAVAVAALTEPGHHGKAYAITGPEALGRDQVAQKLTAAIGHPVHYQPLTPEQFEAGMRAMGAPEAVVELMSGLYGFVRAGQTGEVTHDVQQVTGKAPISFDQFAREHADAWR